MTTDRPDFDALVLAAGLGTRMKSRLPKVLHMVAGRPLVGHVLAALAPLAPARTVVVVGAEAGRFESALGGLGLTFVRQSPPRGTGDAVRTARTALEGSGRLLLVLSGDVPLVRTETLRQLLDAAAGNATRGGALLTARLAEPGSYGRIVRDSGGQASRIVEARDASAEELAIREVNVGIYALPEALVWPALERLEPSNAQKELYLTDLVATFAGEGRPIAPVLLGDPEEMTGVNNRAELARVGRELNCRTVARLLDDGVTFVDPHSAWVEATVEAASDVTIHPFVRLEGATRLATGAVVRSFSRLTNVSVGEDAEILEGVVGVDSSIGARTKVGPWAHLRTGTVLGDDVKVGNFVETKKTRLGNGTKAPHLTYLGDAIVGEKVNVGAGTITCNYDGVSKNVTVLEDGVFIGSDSQLVAPVRVGRGAYVGAGSTVTDEVPPGALAIARARQRNVLGWVEKKAAERRAKGERKG